MAAQQNPFRSKASVNPYHVIYQGLFILRSLTVRRRAT